MFDEYARALFSDFPEFEGLSERMRLGLCRRPICRLFSTESMDRMLPRNNLGRSNPICGVWRIRCCFTWS